MYREQGKGHNSSHGQDHVSDGMLETRDVGALQRGVGVVDILQEGQDLVRVLAEAMRVLAHGFGAFSKIIKTMIDIDEGPLIAHIGMGRRPTTAGPDMPLSGCQSRKRKFRSG
ncbi:hypothetical protein U1Q18_018231 [Sarracenia purpurea var. burkii]